jgi:uncharacterized repeat protein (TIGR01451 family)
MRKLGILAVAGLSSLVLAGTASAATQQVPFEFQYGELGTTLGAIPVATPAQPIQGTASVDTTTFQVTIPKAGITFPTASFSTHGLSGTVQPSLAGPATGQLNPLTGQFVLDADIQAAISVPGAQINCTVDTGAQSYSTDNSNVYGGVRFPNVATGGLTGGAIAGGWTWSVPSTCGALAVFLGSSSGSLWLSTIAPPALSQKIAPVKVVAGKSVTVHVTVTNTGGVAAQNVMVCVAAPSALKLEGAKCSTVASLAANSSTQVKFAFKTSKKARKGTAKVSFTTTANDVAAVMIASLVKIQPAKKTKK